MWMMLLLVAALPAAAASKVTTSKPSPAKLAKVDDGFKPFAVITQRNVFNTNRNPPSPVEAVPTPPRTPKVEALALIGTMSSERGSVAFFDGTSTAYRKAAATGEKIGSCTVLSIEHDRVTLQAGDRELCLPLKMQFYREDQGEWQLTTLPEDFQPSAPPPGQVRVEGRLESKSASLGQIRDHVADKYQRKLEQLANDPVKSEKLRKAMNGEVEARIRKLEKIERRLR